MASPLAQNRLLAFLMRAGVWAFFLAVLFILRSFFLLIFLTFVFSYIQSHAVDKLASRIPHRRTRVVLVALLFISILGGLVAFVTPQFKHQAETFADKYTTYLQKFDVELVRLSQHYPVIESFVPQIKSLTQSYDPKGRFTDWKPENSPSAYVLQLSLGLGAEDSTVHSSTKETLARARNVITQIFAALSAFLLSLLFSFLIVLDLEHLTRSVRGLANTKIGFLYREVGENIREFGAVLGKALEAQLLIALLNTLLTAIGIYAIGLSENLVFFSIIVFLCSFIPLAGVFISSVPIALFALQEGGVYLMSLSIGLITIIHLVEAYILNPKIFGRQLHLNPVLVLIILTIGGKLFNVWGLVLGLPICTYIFGHAIRRKSDSALNDMR
jgi:predicted PurR-regulated permease PerM